MGDGGSGNDPEARAQDRTTLLGKILRIDVDHGTLYAIPPTNPWASGTGGLPEIFAVGLRNPWRFSFDRTTGDFWIGDVGQGAVEEIDLLPAGTGAGANLGWRVVEGNQCTGLSGPVTCSDLSLTAPVITYTHALGCSVTGGFRYRGAQVPSLAARYVYADFCSGILWSAQPNGSGQWVSTQLADTTFGITAFGEDDAGELYFTDYNAGDIYRFVETGAPPPPAMSLTATSLAFGSVNVGSSASQSLTVSNAGGGTLTLSSLSIPSGGPFGGGSSDFVRGGTCNAGTALGASQSCTVSVVFSPAAAGAKSSALSIASNGGNASVGLTGTGVAAGVPPSLRASATSLGFGTVVLGSSSVGQTVTVSNGGGGTLTLSSLTPGGANSGDFARTGTCASGTNLAAGQTCTVVYQFTPTAAGARSASLAIASNGGSTTITVTGTGGTTQGVPVLSASATALNFGLGRSAAQTVTITNTGGGTLTLGTITMGGANASDFVRGGTCANGLALPATQSCTIVVTFAATSRGQRTATIAVTSNGGNVTIALSGFSMR